MWSHFLLGLQVTHQSQRDGQTGGGGCNREPSLVGQNLGLKRPEWVEF